MSYTGKPICRNPECNRLANGTDGQGYCMYCEDDIDNYADVVVAASVYKGPSASNSEGDE